MHCPESENRLQEVSVISRQLKALARELHIPVIVMSQLNRQAENRDGNRPRLGDLRESGTIEQDADVVILLYREDYYRQHDPGHTPNNIAEVIVAKYRNGPTGTIKLHWQEKMSSFRNLDRSDQ
jgi:replicative DNA helicase